MKDRAELYQEIKKFFKQEVEPLLKNMKKKEKKICCRFFFNIPV